MNDWAFPTPFAGGTATEPGMTLRDWFAGQALIGIIASGPHDCRIRELTDEAYQYADAMLESHKQ